VPVSLFGRQRCGFCGHQHQPKRKACAPGATMILVHFDPRDWVCNTCRQRAIEFKQEASPELDVMTEGLQGVVAGHRGHYELRCEHGHTQVIRYDTRCPSAVVHDLAP
jgi:hypothetical protein